MKHTVEPNTTALPSDIIMMRVMLENAEIEYEEFDTSNIVDRFVTDNGVAFNFDNDGRLTSMGVE